MNVSRSISLRWRALSHEAHSVLPLVTLSHDCTAHTPQFVAGLFGSRVNSHTVASRSPARQSVISCWRSQVLHPS